MTRKDYKILADALGEAGKGMGDRTWEATRATITNALAVTYANFDAYEFSWAADNARTELTKEV